MQQFLFICYIFFSFLFGVCFSQGIDASKLDSVWYVHSLKAPVYTEPKIQLNPFFQLFRGDKVTVQFVQGSWMLIEDGNSRDGWIYELLLSQTVPKDEIKSFEDDVVITKSQRVRAAMYSNSAASRGLLADSPLNNREFDFHSVEIMESLSVSLQEGSLFIQQRRLK